MARPTRFPPFPPLTWDGDFWTGKVKLPSWRGFQNRQGPYTSARTSRRSTGLTAVYVVPKDDEERVPPTVEQGKAFQFLVDHEPKIQAAVVAAIFQRYPEIRESYGDDDGPEMPLLTHPQQLQSMIGLGTVHVLNVKYANAAYVGFELGCNWDEEHGLGVLTHKQRIVALGEADTAFDEETAESDARKQQRKKREHKGK